MPKMWYISARWNLAAGWRRPAYLQHSDGNPMSTPIPPPSAHDDDVAIWNGLPIRTLGDWQQTVDVYAPPGGGPRPVLVCLHGGGWRTGAPSGYRHLALHLTRRYDLVVVSASYRLIDRATFPIQIQDAANAVRWVRANATLWSIDGKRLAVCGASAGGYLSAMIALTHADPALAGGDPMNGESAAVQALVVQWGPLDFIARWYGNGGRPGAEEGMLGANYLQDPTIYHHASALSHVGPHAPPALFVQGRQDRTVHQQQGELGHAAWQRHGRASELCLLDRIGHCDVDPADAARETAAITAFLARQLSPAVR
jgi:acetyl esterase/lipase